MSEEYELSEAEYNALKKSAWRKLVKAANGSPAVAVFLGVSDAYVRQLYLPEYPDKVPSIRKHFLAVERWIQNPAGTRELARLSEPEADPSADLVAAAKRILAHLEAKQ